MKRYSFILAFAAVPILAFAQPKKDTIRVFYLGGQSNMEGFGKTAELPDALQKKFTDVYIYHGNPTGDEDQNGGLGKWDILQPGHGSGFASNGKVNTLSDRFGIEITFAKRLSELYPRQKIAIIKYARNGSSIDSIVKGDFGCWEPDYKGKGPNQYDFFLKTVRDAMAVKDINGDGRDDILVPSGIVWMQGESDAYGNEAVAHNYFSNLKRLMDLMRAALHNNDIPVVIGKISDSGDEPDGKVWSYGEIVQAAQEKYAATAHHAAIVRTTSTYQYSDKFHYNTAGYIDFGKQCADAIAKFKFF
ncbi:sialate O-acetylesterase [Flavobacterium sp.]|uniref:sialate O-acetylesterase n=1 Tax=Flavobacterium sp. TaxID=239 RepID=UPI00261B9AE6|nr:sialate O-acetylesterase [Flavobacterium sp.]